MALKKATHRLESIVPVCGATDVEKAAAAVAIAINLLAPAWTINIEICYCPAAANIPGMG